MSTVFRVFWYSLLVSSNICSLEELSKSHLPMDFAIWSMAVGDWFEDVLMYRSWSFSFLN